MWCGKGSLGCLAHRPHPPDTVTLVIPGAFNQRGNEVWKGRRCSKCTVEYDRQWTGKYLGALFTTTHYMKIGIYGTSMWLGVCYKKTLAFAQTILFASPGVCWPSPKHCIQRGGLQTILDDFQLDERTTLKQGGPSRHYILKMMVQDPHSSGIWGKSKQELYFWPGHNIR